MSCANGEAVSDAANNPGLVSDCEVLLAARDTLAGDAMLDWSAGTPIERWEGVYLYGSPQRVTGCSCKVWNCLARFQRCWANFQDLKD